MEQPCYLLINIKSEGDVPSEQKLKDDLMSDDLRLKISGLKRVILMISNGEKIDNRMLMTVIRFVMPTRDHTLKKLLLLFWEIVPKYGQDGKLLQEMILVCDAYRKDLQHPNEFIRGLTLRFLCKLKEQDLLEPLMPSILQCLEHRHCYVRRNAVLAIFTIYKNFSHLIPDAPEKIYKFLEQEQDSSCKRNAFMMLIHASQEKALEYLSTCVEQVHTFGDTLQLIIVELIYKVCRSRRQERGRFIRCVYNLLQSNSAAVRYEAAGTLITLTSAVTAVRAVAACYIDLVLKESDNNVKLIVLDRLISLREQHEKELQSSVMDVLRILGASDLEVRKKTLQLALGLTTTRTAEEVVTALKKELVKFTSNTASESDGVDEKIYRYYIVKTIYKACIRFPEMISSVVPALCELLTYENDTSQQLENSASEEVCKFLREVILRYPQHKVLVLEKLMEYYPSIRCRTILRYTMWILGEFCTESDEIGNFMNLLYQVLGPLPLVENEMKRISGDSYQDQSALLSADGGITQSGMTRVTADGTYATQTALTSTPNQQNISGSNNTKEENSKRPCLQAALFHPDFMPGTVLAVALVKLFCRYSDSVKNRDDAPSKLNKFAAECMLVIASMINLAKSELLGQTVNPDHIDRMWLCIKALGDRQPDILRVFSETSRKSLDEMISTQELQRKADDSAEEERVSKLQELSGQSNRIQLDTPVNFNVLQGKSSDMGDLVDRFDYTMSQALGDHSGATNKDIFSTSKLSKVTQLTGVSDPIYAEAYVNVNQYDIVLDILVVNQTSDTLQNLTVELATLGDLKLVEKPAPVTMGPQQFTNIKANIKVSSSENGIIFGNIVYDVGGAAGECNCVVLNDVHIDILEYLEPANISRALYRKMWTEFEWENKVTVNTKITDLKQYLQHVQKHTNMRCLTPMSSQDDDDEDECDYLCVTLYARSVFGEHVLANICLEKPPGLKEPVTGHLRIRAKSQGMAVTMGEKVSQCQKMQPGSETKL